MNAHSFRLSTKTVVKTYNQLRTLVTLIEDPGSVLGIHMVIHNHLQLQFQGT